MLTSVTHSLHQFLRAGVIATAALLPLAVLPHRTALAQAPTGSADATVLAAREALRKNDRAGLLAARNTLARTRHPLAQWADYWELNNRLAEAQQPELEAFYARWPKTYVEDRLRNDWLLELGRRQDWANLRVEFPRFRMNDDREVTCYWLTTQHLDGQDVRAAALPVWQTLRDADDGCTLLGKTLFEAKVFTTEDAWQAARLATEGNRLRTARNAAALVSTAAGIGVAELWRDPARFLNHPASVGLQRELAVLALMRLAVVDPEAAATQLESQWQRQLSASQAGTAWAHLAKQAALKQQTQAASYAERAWRLRAQAVRTGHELGWSDELLAWHVRAALRQPAGEKSRWLLMQQATAAMSAKEQADPAWVYWRARGTQALAAAGAEGDAARSEARQALLGLAGLGVSGGFYAKLAAEDLGQRAGLSSAAAAVQASELNAARGHPGLTRGLQLISLGLRSEGVREWNFSLRGMNDRELLAAAQTACLAEVWDRCINTSERTRSDIDMAQRFPLVHIDVITRTARQTGVDPALELLLIRQESRFIMDARSGVGASGLMQLMPATARYVAKKQGVPYSASDINDRDLNLRLGMAYLKDVLDDFGGSMPMATAAYNAGPGRPRRWRDGPPMEPAAWAESIPFNETRDYVKKVLSNAVVYSLLLGAASSPGSNTATAAAASAAPPNPGTSLKARLGPLIAPRGAAAPPFNTQLP